MTWNISDTIKKAGETRTYIVCFSEKLCTGEVLTGTPTVEELRTSALTLSDAALTSTEWTISGRPIKAYTAVQFTVSGGTARTDYTIRVTAGTDSSPEQTLIIDMRLSVQ